MGTFTLMEDAPLLDERACTCVDHVPFFRRADAADVSLQAAEEVLTVHPHAWFFVSSNSAHARRAFRARFPHQTLSFAEDTLAHELPPSMQCVHSVDVEAAVAAAATNTLPSVRGSTYVPHVWFTLVDTAY